MRIHVMPEIPSEDTEWACGAIRLIRPYRHAYMQTRADISFGSRLPRDAVNVIVTQRGGPCGFSLDDAIELRRTCRLRGIKLIYDLDDDLLSSHPDDHVDQDLEAHRSRVRHLLCSADLVVVSTQELKARVARMNPNVQLWENSVDDGLILNGDRRPAHKAFKIGYFGTPSHIADLLPVRSQIEHFVSMRRSASTFEWCGLGDQAALRSWFPRIAQASIRPGIGDYVTFFLTMQQRLDWQVGLAPLNPHPFNTCKSDIKFLEYAIFGIPGIYADVPSYATIQDGVTGLRVGATDWFDALERYADDPDLRERVCANARDYVLNYRTLEKTLPSLWSLVQGVI